MIQPSVKEQIVLAAERLFAAHGLEGVSLRQVSTAAGNGNNSAVQYHFGSRDRLIQAIFEYRLPDLNERRRVLAARLRPNDLRSWVECHIVPVLEQGEQQGSHYLGFVAKLQQTGRRDVFDQMSDEFRQPTRTFREAIAEHLAHIPEPLRSHRVAQAMAFAVHAGSQRERAQLDGGHVLPFDLHVQDLIDGLVGFLSAPTSVPPSTSEGFDPTALALPFHP
ncbi:TetR/AcrR family transcriptional regulator [Yinghuangia sp. ASG 101]|uniref:TetR/AcrR family transcriptional regulator n=1 Tax=Yinghuangia sp. ASG 101 TaxID=2896848 RepID=UPI001E540024|nr:TetR/AcrR family transcriptional regulator [Yinghuangia sp. ASG 101]UGQ12347.1 TetR/AcrR family transcriptional regulator [Yinghuangia sp. ASG 101]